MKAEEYRGTFGPFLTLRVDEKHGLVAMFRRGAGDPHAINAQRLPLILGYLKAKMDDPAGFRCKTEQEDAQLTLAEIEKALAAVAAHPVSAGAGKISPPAVQ